MNSYAGATITPVITNAPQSLVGTLTAGVKALPLGTNLVAPVTTGIVEFAQADSTSNYQATIVIPSSAADGDYEIVWTNGAVVVTEALTIAAVNATPSGADLCTLADVREQQQYPVANTAQDALIQDYISDASELLMAEYECEWAPTSTAVTRSFLMPWENEMCSLAPYSLRAATTVVVDADQGSGVTLSTDEYRLRPIPARDGVYHTLDLRPFSAALGRVMYRDRQINVTGDWGYATVPRAAKRACAMTVGHWLVVSSPAHRMADDNPDAMAPPKRGIPPEARELLRRFRRAVV